MLSEYRKQCPKCGYLRALYYREPPSREFHIECRKCGLEQTYLLPVSDEKAEDRLFKFARERLERAYEETHNLISAKPITNEHADELIEECKNCNKFLPLIHQQLTYILRLLQGPLMMEHGLDAVMRGDLQRYDIVRDSWMAEGVRSEDDVRNLNNHYFGFEKWIDVGLRSVGLGDDVLLKQKLEWWSDVEREETEHIKNGGNPYRYNSVQAERLKLAEARIALHERENKDMCLTFGCRNSVVGNEYAHCERHLDQYEAKWKEAKDEPVGEALCNDDQLDNPVSKAMEGIFESIDKRNAQRNADKKQQNYTDKV